MMWGYGWEWGWPMVLWMSLVGLFWLAVLGLLAWALIRWLGGRAPGNNILPGQGPSALEILRQRYARGEIDATTYEQMRERLRSPQEPLTAIGEYNDPTDLRN